MTTPIIHHAVAEDTPIYQMVGGLLRIHRSRIDHQRASLMGAHDFRVRFRFMCTASECKLGLT